MKLMLVEHIEVPGTGLNLIESIPFNPSKVLVGEYYYYSDFTAEAWCVGVECISLCGFVLRDWIVWGGHWGCVRHQARELLQCSGRVQLDKCLYGIVSVDFTTVL